MGSKPKAPPAPEDPAVIAERSRRAGQAIAQAEQRRSTRAGSASTILSKQSGAQILRPTDAPSLMDPYQTEAGKKMTAVEDAKAKVQELEQRGTQRSQSFAYGDNPQNEFNINNIALATARKDLQKAEKGVTEADKMAFTSAKTAQAIGRYVQGVRSRVGVKKSGRAA